MADWAKTLQDELSWREAELASLKLATLDAQKGSLRQAALLRCLCAMLYAHYEGFFKFAWDFYLGELEKLNVTRDSCCEPVTRFSMAKNFQELRGNTSLEGLWDYVTKGFPAVLKQQIRFDVKLETNSNLWPRVAKENSAQIGLPTAQIDANYLALRSLVGRRNEIAHGKKLDIKDIADYQPFEDAAFLAMHELAIAVIDALESKAYLKA